MRVIEIKSVTLQAKIFIAMKRRILFAVVLLSALTSSVFAQGYRNPIINADVPDNSLCRVGDYYYMVSTTMHLMPGGPIMRSKDLKTWETISYVFDRIDDGDRYNLIDGKTVYGQGQWASCIRHYFGKFYVWFTTNGSKNGFLFSAKNPAGPWKLVCRPPHFHDSSLFVDDDGRVYMFYGSGEAAELTRAIFDETGKVWGEEAILRRFKVPVRDGIEDNLLEGSNMNKINGKYYLLMISWPKGHVRREVCYRAESLDGPWEKKIILNNALPPFNHGGVAQGAIVDSPTGEWHGIFFQDRNGVGRTPCYIPCRWENGWPILGDAEGKVLDDINAKYIHQSGILGSDEFGSEKLSLYWEWNHNPIPEAWTLTERTGFLRLKTNRVVDNLFVAPNTITQRMEGPECTGTVCLDISKMQDGDKCGLAAFCGVSACLTISKVGKKWFLNAEHQTLTLNREHAVDKVTVKQMNKKSVSVNGKKCIYLRVHGDFTDGRDIATLSYSLDGKKFIPIGDEVKMLFDIRTFFMGTKFAIFNYATKSSGGYVDVDWFRFSPAQANETAVKKPVSLSDLDLLNTQPKLSNWYKVEPVGAINSDGSQWMGVFKKGKENKVMVIFCGGGACFDSYSEARGLSVAGENMFYTDNMNAWEKNTIGSLQASFAKPSDENPFKDWSIVCLPYTTGDFHCGDAEHEYTGLDGKQHTMHYHGFENYTLMMKQVVPLLGTPEALVITGFSAGGFATAILTDDVLSYFPYTKNVTSCVDASLMIYEKTKNVAESVWKVPARISNRVVSDNITLDCLKALHKDKPYVKILFGCSTYDQTLTSCQTYIDDGAMRPAYRKALDMFFSRLKTMCSEFQKDIPNGGLYIWNDIVKDKKTGATAHTTTFSGLLWADHGGHGGFGKWMADAVNGNVKTYGLELLK